MKTFFTQSININIAWLKCLKLSLL